jgi:S-adenosylmethionine/arginine decarboxylase-like enzyme
MAIVHQHLIYQAKVEGVYYGENSEDKLRDFMNELLEVIDMECLIPAQFKFSHQKAWTGIIGVITSHVAFHYWTEEKYIQLDIYSCKKFDRKKAVEFINNFWQSSDEKVLFLDREMDKNFEIKRVK